MTHGHKLKYCTDTLNALGGGELLSKLHGLNGITPEQKEKLWGLFISDWSMDMGEVMGPQANQGIMFIELVYKIVKKLESEGKL